LLKNERKTKEAAASFDLEEEETAVSKKSRQPIDLVKTSI
jgi:hypothetical protein